VSLHADQRDATKEPPAMLDPYWVLMMRKRLRDFQATGDLSWYKRDQDWTPAARGREDASADAMNIKGGN
jgi:hypothetical protein